VFGFDFELLLAGLADPTVFTLDECVVVDSFAVVFNA
jgi:hypothetical protein